MKKYVIIVAGGKGLRMGTELPKQFLLLRGLPVLMHTLSAFFYYDADISIVLVLPKGHQEYWKELCEKYDFTVCHQIADGGKTRFHSVKSGLEAISNSQQEMVLIGIHDGVRPLISKKVIGRCFDGAARIGGAFPVIPVTDTLRKNDDTGSYTVNREDYCLVQTPQVFRSDILYEAFRQPFSDAFTDDVSVVEALGKFRMVTVEGERENLKITTPLDLRMAEAIGEKN